MTKERILVVEDEEDILELVRFNLSREGYSVMGAASGASAIAAHFFEKSAAKKREEIENELSKKNR